MNNSQMTAGIFGLLLLLCATQPAFADTLISTSTNLVPDILYDSSIIALSGDHLPLTPNSIFFTTRGSINDVEYISGFSGRFYAAQGGPPLGVDLRAGDGGLIQNFQTNVTDQWNRIAINSSGRAFVTSNQGQIFSPNESLGTMDFVAVVGTGLFQPQGRPGPIAFAPDGNLYFIARPIGPVEGTMARLFRLTPQDIAAGPHSITFADPFFGILDLTFQLGAGPTALLAESNTSLLYGTNAGEIYRINLATLASTKLLDLPGGGPTEDLEADAFGLVLASSGRDLLQVDVNSGRTWRLFTADVPITGITGQGFNASAVPEPSTFALVLIATLGFAGGRLYQGRQGGRSSFHPPATTPATRPRS